ncbi:hypothetical protein D3C87_1500650 [compost metagenome]
MPRLLHCRAVQAELGKPLRARRVIMANQLAALVVLGKSRIARTVTQAFRANRFAVHRLLEHRQRTQLLVILHPAPGTPAIPVMERLPRLTRQRHTPPGIDAVGTQHRAGQGVNRLQIRRCRSVQKQPRVPLRNRAPCPIMGRAVDPCLRRHAVDVTPVTHGADWQPPRVTCSQARGVAVD